MLGPYGIVFWRSELKWKGNLVQTVKIDSYNITFYSKKDLETFDFGDDKYIFADTFRLLYLISRILKVECPDIAFAASLESYNDQTDTISLTHAITYTHSDVPGLNNNAILLALDTMDPYSLTGTLAHEMRHLWQNEYRPEMNAIHANGFRESLTHPAEIDADAFAIWYISGGMSMEEAGGIVCPEEKKKYPKEFSVRVKLAQELKEEYDQVRDEIYMSMMKEAKHARRESIKEKLKGLFSLK
jgi:hypothetical protein